MAALTSIRGTVKSTLLALLRDNVAPDVQVERAFPATIEKRTVILGDTRGRHDPAAIAANRLRRDDTFSIEVFFGVKVEGNDPTEAEEQCEELFAALENIAAADSRLGLGTTSGLLWARIGDVDGPDLTPATEGYDAWLKAELVCHTRLT